MSLNMVHFEQPSLPVIFPALLATFYYTHDQERKLSAEKRAQKSAHYLAHYLAQELGLPLPNSAQPNEWHGEDQQAQISFHLTCFTPNAPYAKDVTLVQLVISDIPEDRKASDSWPKMQAHLEGVMSDKTVGQIFGYTLIYQAVIPDSRLLPTLFGQREAQYTGSTPQSSRDPTFSQMLPQIDLKSLFAETRRPHLPANFDPLATFNPLATTSVLNDRGQVWLLNIPNIRTPQSGHHLEKGNVYLALCFKGANQDLIARVLFEQGTDFFMPELIAQKGYNQIRQYRLADKGQTISHEITSIAYDTKQQLENIKAITKLDRLRISLARQLDNYERKTKQLTNNPIIAYHANQMQAAHQELEYIVEEGRCTLQATDTAVSILQTRHQWRIEILLALAGPVIAASQLFDEKAATAFLKWRGFIEPTGGYHRFLTLRVQLGVTITIVVTLITLWYLGKRLLWLLGKIRMLWKIIMLLVGLIILWYLGNLL